MGIKEIKKIIDANVIQACITYSENINHRLYISNIPFIGGSIDLILSATAQNFIGRRIEKLLAELQIETSKLSFEKIDKNFLESEEWFDILLKSFEHTAKTRHEFKIKLFSKIITSSIRIDRKCDKEEPEMFLKLIDELLVKELQVLFIFYKMNKNPKTYPPLPENQNEKLINGNAKWINYYHTEFKEEELVSILLRLEKNGLIKEVVGMIVGYEGGRYEINSVTERFFNFIKEEEHEK